MSFLWRQFDDVYTKTYFYDFPNHYVFLTIMLQFLQGVETMIYNWREERRSGYSLCRHCHLKDWMMNLSSCNVVVSWWPYIDVQMCINTASLYLTQVAQLDKNNGERGQCEEVIWYISLLKSLCKKMNKISSIGSSGPQQKKDLFQFKRELSNEHSWINNDGFTIRSIRTEKSMQVHLIPPFQE